MGLDYLLQPFPLVGRMDLPRYGHDIVKGSDYDKTTRQGDLTSSTSALGRYRFFQYLNQDMRLAIEYFIDLPVLMISGSTWKVPNSKPPGVVSFHRLLREFGVGSGHTG